MSENDAALLHTEWFGAFIIKDGKVIDHALFSKSAQTIAEKRSSRNDGEILEEERELAEDYEGELKVFEERLTELGELSDEEAPKLDPEEYSFDNQLLQEALLEEGKKKVVESMDYGKHLAKAVMTVQDLNETINILMERLRDWYSLHFPELVEEVSEEEFLELVERYGNRNEIMEEREMSIGSTGGDITETEKNLYTSLARVIREKREMRDNLEEYVEKRMRKNAPTITELTGPKLGGELIAAAGSLKKMARMPSSTIQVLGAEKALFRHLEDGTAPPKHGYILQHPYVHKAPKDLRGKISRLFANKIAIAARVDYFGERDMGKEMRKELEEKIEEIKG